MISLLETFKDAIIVKVLIAIIMFFFTWVSNTQIEKNSNFYKSTKVYNIDNLENCLKLKQPKITNETLAKNNKQFYAKR
ncbi:hypothetical protein [uncultured Polaribacter sp.]|uniref:hypothetical protein n=1 Tax=uncultured Polaribacter sp. TaxID=174711 RepID=UPI00262A89D4|nr:hypothetical protein [uncultured Polaribacter sp.]